VTAPSPGRPPLQARSRRTLARILDASHALIAEHGRGGVTVQDVVARARVSVGSFYARFAGRDELLRYLDEDFAALERGRWDAELAKRIASDAPLEARVRAVVELLISSSAHVSHETHALLRAAAATALLAGNGIRHPEPEAAIELGYAATLGAARHRPPEWPDDRLAAELVRMWTGYLGVGTGGDARGDQGRAEEPKGEEPSDEPKSSVDFFEVWA
jgi:AcrR family transcriptional regulator